MAVYKCKMCGGSLEIEPGTAVATCEYCGTQQTLPRTADDVVGTLFNRANNLRLKSEFDKAAETYEKVIAGGCTDAEAYWGLVLCKFGIEYVEDPATYKRIPTCHRAQNESILSDVDYLAALENATPEQRAIYEAEAAAIAVLQRDILAIARQEEPFDVFICYKETDAEGKRTQDSVIANDIYHQLTGEGMKVFYAAITLEDKLGQAYEPYIFAALQSAKVMLVVGTRPEYFTATWVKNEWSRFLKIVKADRSKLLIPCYRDMDAYDLPEEFAHLQAQDMSKIGFISDVVRGIKKVMQSSAAPASAAAAATAPPVTELWYNEGIYRGDVVAGKPHGKGRIEYKNGAVYEGDWAFGEYCGQGKRIYNDSVFEGTWKDGKRNGPGVLTWNKGGSFTGQWVNDKMDSGEGIWRHNDGAWYEGPMSGAQRNGEGTYHYPTGTTWTGYWVDGKKGGKGVMTYSDGAKFTGVWRDDKVVEGEGVYHYTDSIYYGVLKNGGRSGKFRLEWTEGGVFEGYQDTNGITGKGVWLYERGSIYDGEFVNGKFQGEGTYTIIPNPASCTHKKMVGVGTWKKDDLQKGTWTYYHADGSVWEAKVVLGKELPQRRIKK